MTLRIQILSLLVMSVQPYGVDPCHLNTGTLPGLPLPTLSGSCAGSAQIHLQLQKDPTTAVIESPPSTVTGRADRRALIAGDFEPQAPKMSLREPVAASDASIARNEGSSASSGDATNSTTGNDGSVQNEPRIEARQPDGEGHATGAGEALSDRGALNEASTGTNPETGSGSTSTYSSISGPKDWREAVYAATAPIGSSQLGENPAERNGATDNSLTGATSGTNNEHLKHPMNRNIPDLQIPANTGTLTASAVKDHYRKLAKAYLASFSNGIYRQLYFDILRRRTYALTPPGANKGIQSMLFQIIGGKVYLMDPYEVPKNSKPFYRTRINEVIWLLSKLAGEGRIKNTEFLMSIHDCVQTVNQPHTYRGAQFQESNPSFTIVNCNFSNNIPFPMWEGSRNRDGGFSGWDEQMREYAQDETPWERKFDKAVFRGGNRPSMYFRNKSEADDHCNEVGRTRLLYLSKQQPDLLDVSIGGSCGGSRTVLERLEPKEHHKFKYIMYAEGNCMWADRTRQQVFGPSVIIKQETPCGQFFEPLLKPFTHYIPTDFFFMDTIEKVKWAKEHDEDAKAIVKNANEFAHNFLSLRGIEAYVEVLLEEYTALLVEPEIKLENGAVDVTNKQV